MAVGDSREALVAGIAEHCVSTLTKLAGGRPGEGGVERVDLCQQADVGRGIAAGEGRRRRRAAPVMDAAGVTELLDEARHLRPGQAGDLLQIAAHQALVGLAQPGVAKAA